MVVCTRHRGGSSAGQSSGLIIRRSWVRAPPAPPAILFRISPSLWSDLLVVKDVVARPGTVIVFHQVCDRYMGTSTSPRSRRARGARGVIRNTGERSALHPPLLSSPPQGPAQSACTTMPIGDPPQASLSRQGPGYRARKSALVTHPPKCVARPRRRSRVATGLCSFRGHRGPGGPVKPGLGPPGSYNASPGPASSRWISATSCLAGGRPGMSTSVWGLWPSAMRCHRSSAIWVK